MLGREVRDDFTGTGLPNLAALAKLTGFESDAKERNQVWEEFKTEQEYE
jgi:hypothetical protein